MLHNNIMNRKLDEHQAALLLLRALEERGERRPKPLTRARLSHVTLRRLWRREQLTREWFDGVNEWLLSAGWVLFQAGPIFGVVKTSVVENWPRVAAKHIAAEIEELLQDRQKFQTLDRLFEKGEPAATKQIPARRRKRTQR